jgi:hypothetical protein
MLFLTKTSAIFSALTSKSRYNKELFPSETAMESAYLSAEVRKYDKTMESILTPLAMSYP